MGLEPGELEQRLADTPQWRLDEKTISRRFRFRTFTDAMAFANAVAEEAERRNHHPFIAIDYRVVTLRLTSWHAGGLTHADFDEAAALDALYQTLNPTSDGENP